MAAAVPAASADKKQKKREPITDTALHILKGAVVKVLHTPLTVTVECDTKVKGRLTVEYKEPTPPTQAQIDDIERLANEKIQENVDIRVIQIAREEAERTFQASPVNETFIYDKQRPPAQVTELALVHIEDWNINCCPAQHLARTGDVGGIKVVGFNHRPQKGELEFRFDIVAADAAAVSSGKGKGKKPSSAPVAAAAAGGAFVPKAPVTHESQ